LWAKFALALLAALPACAELKMLRVEFEPSDCATCTQSLPERIRRIRGVASARLSEGKPPRLDLEFAAGNRVRFGRVRETIEQDGTKWVKAHVEASGLCEKQGDGWVFKLFEGAGTRMKGRVAAGSCSVSGTIGRDGILVSE
jgi:hypothetical protein